MLHIRSVASRLPHPQTVLERQIQINTHAKQTYKQMKTEIQNRTKYNEAT